MHNIDSIDRTHILEIACQYVKKNHPEFPDIRVKNIIDSGIQDDFIIILADCGIKGVPKFRIPIGKLEFTPKPEPKPKQLKRKPANGRRKQGAKKK